MLIGLHLNRWLMNLGMKELQRRDAKLRILISILTSHTIAYANTVQMESAWSSLSAKVCSSLMDCRPIVQVKQTTNRETGQAEFFSLNRADLKGNGESCT